jgi:glutaminyl-tRNA synthetase
MEDPPKKFFRLSPGSEVRLRAAYIIKCESIIKDPVTDQITEIHCTYDPNTKSGMPESNRKVKGTLHWVSVKHAVPAEVRLYDRLFIKENPDDLEDGQDYKDLLNPDSLKTVTGYLEPSVILAKSMDKFQFERIGYFCADKDSSPEKLIFNRTVTLKGGWVNIEKNH